MTTPTLAGPQRKPYDEEIDVYGLTHAGKGPEGESGPLPHLRPEEAAGGPPDQPARAPTASSPEPERLAFLMMVADGVGGGVKGEAASRTAVEAVTQYVEHSMRCYYAAGAADDRGVLRGAQGRGIA